MQTIESVDLEAVFQTEIPCGGCGKPAELRTFGHGGCPVPMPIFSCVRCYADWLKVMNQKLAVLGVVACTHCRQVFRDADSFAEWRPF